MFQQLIVLQIALKDNLWSMDNVSSALKNCGSCNSTSQCLTCGDGLYYENS